MSLQARPAKSFVVCGMPRSGTTFLAGLLQSTGLVGLAREYFSLDEEPEGARADYAAFVAQTVADKSAHGVFGVKFVANQLWDFVAWLRSLPGNDGLSDLGLLEQVFPGPRFVWVGRHDVVAQAVSWSKAHQTRQWWSGARRDTDATPVFDFREIQGTIAEILRGNEAWQEWFVESRIEPLRVVYEELVPNRVEVTRQVLGFLDVEMGDDLSIEERTAKQGDGLNEEWIARYRSLLSRNSAPNV